MGFVNTIITHITNGNKNEERLVNVMGGTVIETESERLIRKGREEGIEGGVALCKRFGIPFADAVAQAASSFSLTIEDAESRVKKYW